MARPGSDVDVARYCAAIHRSRLVLRRPRQEVVDMVREVAGNHYSDEGAKKDVPINLMGMYQTIVSGRLVAENPRVMLTTQNRGIRPVVDAMEAWINPEIQRIELKNTLEQGVVSALYSVGIVMVGLCNPAYSALLGWGIKAGEPFAVPVDLDDFVFDIHARNWSECAFIGHRYRAPLRAVRKWLKGRAPIEASEDKIFNLEGDERISLIGRTTLATGAPTEAEDMVDLWQIYLPRDRVVMTLHDDQLTGAGQIGYEGMGKALDMQPWLGPDCGPYHILGFGKVLGNIMPKAPMQDLFDMHLSINRILRKLMYQAHNVKENSIYSGGAEEDAKRVNDANDGDWARLDNPDKVRTVVTRNINQQLFQFFGALREAFNWLAGNLEIMGGLGPQAKTAHQDELLNENQSATIGTMQAKVTDWTASIMRSLCWYWHHNPQKVMQATYELPGTPEFQKLRLVHPAGQGGPGRLARDHTFEEMRITVDPYSLPYSSPQQRLAALNQVVTQVITPLMQFLQQQGVAFDVNAYLQKVQKLGPVPDLSDIVTMQEPPQQQTQGQGGMAPPTSPAQTTRNYNRRSSGGATTAGQDLTRANAMKAAPSPNGAVPVTGAGIG